VTHDFSTRGTVKERIFIKAVILEKCDFVAAFNQQCAGGMAKK
jgi:hypothetical protein